MKKAKNKFFLKNTSNVIVATAIITSFVTPVNAQILQKTLDTSSGVLDKKIPVTPQNNSVQVVFPATPGISVAESVLKIALQHIKVPELLVYRNAFAETLKVELINNDSHTEIVPEYTENGLKFVLRYDQNALDNPSLLIKDLALMTVLTDSLINSATFNYIDAFHISSHTLAELLTNVREGSLTAKAQWLELQANILKTIKMRTEFLEHYKLDTSVFNQAITSIQQKAEIATEEAEKYLKNQRKAYDKWKTETGTLNKLDALNEKLDELVMRNDRKGVRKLLESYLPWTLMEPVETNTWKIWLEAIENPDPNNTAVAFRGIDYTTDKVKQRVTESGEVYYGFMAPVLTKNQGNYNRRLRSLTTNREKNGDRLHLSRTFEGSKSVRISDQMITHADEPVASSFISFTYNPEIALSFVGRSTLKELKNETVKIPGGGMLVVKMDNRRLVPNLPSQYGVEFEVLAPLIVFPDEIFAYKEGLKSWSEMEILFEEIKKKTGLDFKDWQQTKRSDSQTYQEFYNTFGLNFFKSITSVGGKGKTCDAVFSPQPSAVQ